MNGATVYGHDGHNAVSPQFLFFRAAVVAATRCADCMAKAMAQARLAAVRRKAACSKKQRHQRAAK
ncbi:hypothetical protein ACVW04_002708 [Bradyrhizobium sp. LM2.3]